MSYNAEYFNKKWQRIIPKMPHGGSYRFDLRKYGYQIVVDEIGSGKKVFDYACGLGVIDKMLEKNGCKISGCDFSKIAIQYTKSICKGDFKVSEEIFGSGYDYIILSHYLEHLEKPVKWLKKVFNKTNKIICILPNNFYKIGEHVNMKWSNWNQFYDLFKEFKIKRIDKDKYSDNLIAAYRNPIFIFEKKGYGKLFKEKQSNKREQKNDFNNSY